MSYRERLYNASMNGGRSHSILVAIGKEADKEISDLKVCQALTEQNFTDYTEQSSIWLADGRKELEAKDKTMKLYRQEINHQDKVIANSIQKEDIINLARIIRARHSEAIEGEYFEASDVLGEIVDDLTNILTNKDKG